MSSLSTVPKGDSAWLLRKAVQRVMQQVSVLETNIGTSTTGNSANTQVIFNDAGTLRGDPDLIFNTATNRLVALNLEATAALQVGTSATITGNLTVDTSTLFVNSSTDRVGIGTTIPSNGLQVQGAGQATVTPVVTGDQSALLLVDSGTAGNNGGMLVLGASVASGFLGQVAIKSLLSDGTQNGTASLAFFTRGATSDSTLTERYRIAANGVATWSNVGGTSGTAMTLNATGLGIGTTILGGQKLAIGSSSDTSATTNGFNIVTSRATIQTTCNGATDAAGTTINYSWANGGQGPLIFRNAAISNVLTLDAAGNCGIGVTPSAWISSWKAIDINTAGAGLSGTAAITNLTNNCFLNASAQWIYKGNFVASRYQQSGGEHQFYTAVSGIGGLQIGTFTQAMTLDASGNLLVGTTDATQTSGVGTKILGSGLGPYVVNPAIANSALAYTMYSTGAAAYRFYVGWAGTVFATNTTISAISDARLKENVQNLDVGLNEILALKPRKFDWKEGKGKNIKNDRGFIAQEFETVFPNLIDEWADPAPEGEAPYKSVRQDIIPVLVKAIQELAARVQTLEAK